MKQALIALLLFPALLCLFCILWFNSIPPMVNAIVHTEGVSNQADIGPESNQDTRHNPTMEDEFSEEIVLVVLSSSATRGYGEYTVDDFNDIGVSYVKELSESNASERVLSLTLTNPGKANVLKAIQQLKARPDVEYADPSYSGAFAATIDDGETPPRYLQALLIFAAIVIPASLLLVLMLRNRLRNKATREVSK